MVFVVKNAWLMAGCRLNGHALAGDGDQSQFISWWFGVTIAGLLQLLKTIENQPISKSYNPWWEFIHQLVQWILFTLGWTEILPWQHVSRPISSGTKVKRSPSTCHNLQVSSAAEYSSPILQPAAVTAAASDEGLQQLEAVEANQRLQQRCNRS